METLLTCTKFECYYEGRAAMMIWEFQSVSKGNIIKDKKY